MTPQLCHLELNFKNRWKFKNGKSDTLLIRIFSVGNMTRGHLSLTFIRKAHDSLYLYSTLGSNGAEIEFNATQQFSGGSREIFAV